MKRYMWFAVFLFNALQAHAGLIETPVASLPTSTVAGETRIVIDGLTTNDCSIGGGNKTVLCTYDGVGTWYPGGDPGPAAAQGLGANFDIDPTIEGAVPDKPFRFGSGAAPETDFCGFTDTLYGGLLWSCAPANKRLYIHTDKTLEIYDIKGSKPVMTVNPSSDGLGLGSVSVNTDERFIMSNLGLELTASDTNPACSAGKYGFFADLSDTIIKYCNNGIVVPLTAELTIRKTADEALASNTGLQNDDVLLFPVAINSTYTFRMFVRYSGATTGDIKYNFTVPSGTVGEKFSVHAPIGATTCSNTSTTTLTNDITQTDANVGAAGTGAGNICSLVIEGTVQTGGTAGNVTFQWAQVASDVTNTTVHAGSWLTYRRIP